MQKLKVRQLAFLMLLSPKAQSGYELRHMYNHLVKHWLWRYGLSIATFYAEMDYLESVGYVRHEDRPDTINGQPSKKRWFEITETGKSFLLRKEN